MNTRSRRGWSLKETVRRWLTFGHVEDLNVASGLPMATAAGQLLSPVSVLSLSAVWACVGLLSETIATLPLGLYRKSDAGRLAVTNHPLYRVIHDQPNADMTAVQFWQAYLVSLLLWGNGYAEKLVNGQGQTIGLQLLTPECMNVRCLPDGSREYVYTRKGRVRKIPESRIFHVPALSFDGRIGMSPVRAGLQVFGSAAAAEAAANSTFEKGLMPTTYFKMERVLQKEQREEFRENLKKISGALNAGQAPLLEGGMDTGTIGINPVDAQLLESRGFSIEEICRWFRVPPFLVGHSEKSTTWGSGIEQMMIGFITFAIRPWLVRIEQGIKRSLLSPTDRQTIYAEYSVEGLLRGDSAARSALYASALQNGWMNRTTVAQLENLPPVPGGEIFTVQSNLVRLDTIGAAPAVDAASVRAAINFLFKDEDAANAP